MDEQKPLVDQHGDSIKGSAFGFPFEVHGSLTVLLVAILATTGLLFWELQVQNETLSKAVMAHTTEVMANRAVLQEEHHLVMKQHMDIIDLLQAQLYITCQINVECRRYDLALPKVLRELKRP